jgi:hypothetical protein
MLPNSCYNLGQTPFREHMSSLRLLHTLISSSGLQFVHGESPGEARHGSGEGNNLHGNRWLTPRELLVAQGFKLFDGAPGVHADGAPTCSFDAGRRLTDRKRQAQCSQAGNTMNVALCSALWAYRFLAFDDEMPAHLGEKINSFSGAAMSHACVEAEEEDGQSATWERSGRSQRGTLQRLVGLSSSLPI